MFKIRCLSAACRRKLMYLVVSRTVSFTLVLSSAVRHSLFCVTCQLYCFPRIQRPQGIPLLFPVSGHGIKGSALIVLLILSRSLYEGIKKSSFIPYMTKCRKYHIKNGNPSVSLMEIYPHIKKSFQIFFYCLPIILFNPFALDDLQKADK